MGGIDEVSHETRTKVRDAVMSEFGGCRATLPYSLLQVALSAVVPFMLNNIASERDVTLQALVLNYVVMWLPVLCYPCNLALVLRLGGRFVEDDAPSGPVPWRFRHVAAGVAACLALIVQDVVFWALPMKIANGGFESLSPQQRWGGLLLSLCGLAAFVPLTLFLFSPRRGAARRAKVPAPPPP